MTFQGFDEHTFRFLRALARDNSLATFAAQRATYEAHVLAPARAFVEAAAPHLGRLAPALVADPRVDGSLVRLRRDARFQGEGPPFKDRLELWFWEGERRQAVSVLSLVVAPDGVRVGVGARGLRGAGLAAYRDALRTEDARAELARVVRGLERARVELPPPELRLVPPSLAGLGLTPGSAAEALARRRALWPSVPLEASLAKSAALVPRCVAVWKRLWPVHRWLVEHVQGVVA